MLVIAAAHDGETLAAIRADGESATVPLSAFRPSGTTAPDFDRLELDDHGYTLRFGEYEASSNFALARANSNMQFDDIDWANWEPRERATILFVVRDGQILLIRKKRGLGAGKVNGPGGRIESGETPLQGAVREVQEELLVTPTGVEEAGLLRFEFADGFSMSVHVFVASGCEGEAMETDEAVPMWTPIAAIPYGEMWPDDAHWLPLMLEGRTFDGWFFLDGDTLLGHAVRPRRRGWIGASVALAATVGLAAGMWLCRMGSDGTLGWSECLLISGLASAATWLACLFVLRL